jgi:MFS family permease
VVLGTRRTETIEVKENEMDAKLLFALSFAMFMEFAVWAAWMPVLAARLLGPLKMTGKQTGWIYATLPLACIVSPLIAGVLADKYFDTRHILGVAHLVGAVLLFLVANKTSFKSIFGIMLLYCLCYAGTLPLVNAILFANASDVADQGKVFIWAPIAWALIGWSLTGWRWIFKTGEQGKDCLYLAAILSLVMGVGCLMLLPADAPASAADTAGAAAGGMPIVETFKMLKDDGNFLLFFVVSMIFFGLMQFYFLGTAQFMQDMGIPNKNVPASMGIAQAVQAIATFFLMALFMDKLGYKWTLIVGSTFWFLLYVVYIVEKPPWLIVICQSFHGMAYVLFVIVGQIFANSQASDKIRNSMQALLFAATTGVGLFLGTQFAGFIMDKFRQEGRFQWRSIFFVPCAIALVSILVFMIFFKVPTP